MQYNEEQQALIDAPIDEIVIGASAAGVRRATLVGRAESQRLSFRRCRRSFTRNAADECATNCQKH